MPFLTLLWLVVPSHPLQKRRHNPLMPKGFNLDTNVRETLRNMDPDDSRLCKFFSSRSLISQFSPLLEKRAVPPQMTSKFRKNDLVVVDETRLERRRQLAQERLPHLAQMQLKLTQVQQRAQVMHAWITYEDDLAMRSLTAHSTSNVDAAASASSGAPAGESGEHHPTNPEHAMDVTMELTAAETLTSISTPHSQPKSVMSSMDPLMSAPQSDLKPGVNAKEPAPGHERYSFATGVDNKDFTASRSEARLFALHEVERKSGPHHIFSSADMERYLALTVSHAESLIDKTLDCTGNPLSMEEEIFGDVHHKRASAPIVSPWSGRILKPIIRQDYETECKKLQLLREIVNRFHMALPEWIAPPPSPIEYRYLRPYMIPQINKLLCETFWPGIDISESILYPEYTIVAMYKELVIGCAFITTLGYITYICVHPEWRSAGIAKFMLYHLIQTSPGKDITLHVSASNSAIYLYQHFCFLIDEAIPNFYEKYLPSTSSLSRDAFFMRLKR